MGFNTVLIVLNDNLHMGTEDANLGERIQTAVRNWYGQRRRMDLSFFARSSKGASGSYGEVISCDHADGIQIVAVGGNTGWRLDDPEIPDAFVEAAIREIQRRGYKVSKPRKATP